MPPATVAVPQPTNSKKRTWTAATTAKSLVLPKTTVSTRTTTKRKTNPSTITLGRLDRPLVEPPSSVAKSNNCNDIKLLLQVQTRYKSINGCRRQVLSVTRTHHPLEHGRPSPVRCPTTMMSETELFAVTAVATVATVAALGPAKATTAKATATATATAFGTSIQSATETAFIALSELGPITSATVLPVISRYQWMILPEFLSEELWERHQYSLVDIRKTLDVCPARLLWQLLLSYGKSATNASSRVCSDTDYKITYGGGRATAIDKLMDILTKRYPSWSSRPSVTWNMAKADDPNGDGKQYEPARRHIPSVAVHRIDPAEFERINHSIDDAKTKPLKWRGITVMPIRNNASEQQPKADLILMGRVVPWSTYLKAFGPPATPRQHPNSRSIGDFEYVFMEEAFYFFAANPA